VTEIVFYILAVAAVVSGIACIVQRNPVSAALWLVAAMFALAGIYVLLNAQFIGAIQVLVYAGAIMVLFLFVIMLLNLGREANDIRRWPALLAGVAIAAGIVAPLLALRLYSPTRLATEVSGSPVFGDPGTVLSQGAAAQRLAENQGVVGAIAGPLFQTYLVPFEVTSILLLVAAIGAVVLAKRRL
jgi:NADH-quinone oxidoreductase subunit J